VINFIRKTGEVAAGNLGIGLGGDFRETRLDADYGRPLDRRWRFHVGGYYRSGEGPRTVGYTGESGGQIRGNLTRLFTRGFIRLNLSLLNDRAPVYLPEPISITGTNAHPRIASFPGFDVRDGAMQSRYFRHDLSVTRSGRPVLTDIADGYFSKVEAVGGEGLADLGGGWKVSARARVAAISGRFVGPYPAEVNTASALASEIGGPGATLRYATGPRAGQPVAAPGSLNGNGLAVRTHLFNTTLSDLGNLAGDLKLTRSFATPRLGAIDLTLGYFKSRQYIAQDWHWNTYLQEVKGRDAVLLDVADSTGALVTQNGLVAYGEPLWGNCCVRSLSVHYDTDAPYLAANWETGPINVDASLRYDIARASGTYASAAGTRVLDVNGDGTIQAPEQAVPVVDLAAASPVNYTVRYVSYSVGANYLLNTGLALFSRVSRGGRANADRLLFGGGIRPDGSVASAVAVNRVEQVEAGVNWRREYGTVSATLFYARTKVTDQDFTALNNPLQDRKFAAHGLELESAWFWGALILRAGLTYTHGKITRDEITPAAVGQQINPRAQYQAAAAYLSTPIGVGVTVIGISGSPLERGLVLPGFAQVNGFVSYQLTHALVLSAYANNLFNTIGLTESPNGSAGVPANGLAAGRSINGRTLNGSLRYSF
jgi:outer membrane receptor protein involved in Fe transport